MLKKRVFKNPKDTHEGAVDTTYTGETRMLIQGQLHLCLRKVHPSICHRPSWQHVCRKRHPHNVQLLANLQRLSFARPLCNHPFDKPLHPPEPSALPPSSPSSGEGRGKAGGQGDGEVCRRGGCKVASQMTTAYVVRAIER